MPSDDKERIKPQDYAFAQAGYIGGGGLTKREWFAGMALMGMHARDSYDEGLQTPEQRANICFIDADAMIKKGKK